MVLAGDRAFDRHAFRFEDARYPRPCSSPFDVDLDLDALAEVISAGGANSRMWQTVEPWIRSGDESRLKATLWTGAKDLRTYGHMAEAAGVAAFIAQAVSQTLQLALNHGHADRFMPALPGVMAEINGTKIRELG